METIKADVIRKTRMLSCGQELATEAKRNLEKELIALTKHIVEESEIKEHKLDYFVLTKAIMEEMLDYYNEDEDGNLYFYLLRFGFENVAAIKCLMNLEKRPEEQYKCWQEEAVKLLPPLQRLAYALYHEEGETKYSIKKVAEQLQFLDEIKVRKLIMAAEMTHIVQLSILEGGNENDDIEE